MSDDQSPEKPKHRWLAWLGLQEPPPDPAAWIPVASGRVDNPKTGESDYASAVVRELADGGIEAHQRPYVIPDGMIGALNGGPEPVDRIRVAVLVHERDVERGRLLITTSETPKPGGSPLDEGDAAVLLSTGAGPGI